MARLEDLKAGARIQGLAPGGGPARVVNVEWFGDQAVEVIFEDAQGRFGTASPTTPTSSNHLGRPEAAGTGKKA